MLFAEAVRSAYMLGCGLALWPAPWAWRRVTARGMDVVYNAAVRPLVLQVRLRGGAALYSSAEQA